MRTEQQIRDRIKSIEASNQHVLTGEFSDIMTNAPRALMQLHAKAQLECLYFVLGEKCPTYEYEKPRRKR